MPKQYLNKELVEKVVACIKQYRKTRNITLETFYFDTGIHIARIEQGKTNLTVSTLAKICDYLGISLKEFFTTLENLDDSNRNK